MDMRIAAITTVYNERQFLPLWIKHYGRQVGYDNLFIIDNGSNDGSTDGIEGNVIRLPRAQYDEFNRVNFVTMFAAGLKLYYDAFVYSDCDEFIVPDPAKYANLSDFVSTMDGNCAWTVGLNVVYCQDKEESIDLGNSILSQRSFVRFTSEMCKPLIGKAAIRWGAGFHVCDRERVINRDLFLFHLKYIDRKLHDDIHNLRKSVEISERSKARNHGSHWQRSDEDVTSLFFSRTHAEVEAVAAPDLNFSHSIDKLEKNKSSQHVNFISSYAKIPSRFHDAISGAAVENPSRPPSA